MFKPKVLLKVALAIFFFLILVLQFFSFPGKFRFEAEQHPDTANLRWPLTFLFIGIFGAVEILIVTVWKVITNLGVKEKTQNTINWVKASIAALWFIWTVIALLLAWLLPQADDPGFPFLMIVIEIAVSIIGLLFMVYRDHLSIKVIQDKETTLRNNDE